MILPVDSDGENRGGDVRSSHSSSSTFLDERVEEGTREKIPEYANRDFEALREILRRIKSNSNKPENAHTYMEVSSELHDMVHIYFPKPKKQRFRSVFVNKHDSDGLTLRLRTAIGQSNSFCERQKLLIKEHHSICGLPVTNITPAQGLYFEIKPEIMEARIYDKWSPSDYFNQFWCLEYILFFSFAALMIISMPYLVSIPIVFIDITGSESIFAGNATFNATTGVLSESAYMFSPSVVEAATAIFTIATACACIVNTAQLLTVNIPMLHFQWQTSKFTILINMGMNLVYTLASCTMFPNSLHIMYMYSRYTYIALMVFFDSKVAHERLRDVRFHKKFGSSNDQKRGPFGLYLIFFSVFRLVLDMFRHYLILFVTDEVSLISIDVTNPFNGNVFQFTNRQLADVSYFTAMIFAARALKNAISGAYFGCAYTISTTKFVNK